MGRGRKLTSSNNRLSNARQLDEDDVSESLLSVISDSDDRESRGRVVGGPLVVGGVSGGYEIPTEDNRKRQFSILKRTKKRTKHEKLRFWDEGKGRRGGRDCRASFASFEFRSPSFPFPSLFCPEVWLAQTATIRSAA